MRKFNVGDEVVWNEEVEGYEGLPAGKVLGYYDHQMVILLRVEPAANGDLAEVIFDGVLAHRTAATPD